MVKVYGVSDDLVEIEGSSYWEDEIGCYDKDVPEGNRLLDKLPECLFTVRRNERGATYHLTKTGLDWLGRQLKIKITERR